MTAPRITPLDPPYVSEVTEAFAKIVPPGMEPIRLFRVFANHLPLLGKQMSLGALLLNHGKLTPRDREIVLHRTCARCGCEYEWGVHATLFARRLGFSQAEIDGTAAEGIDPVWNERDTLLIRAADELHDTANISDALWGQLTQHWTTEQVMEIVAVAGFYHAISFMANAFGVELESFGERFPTASSPA